jgi:hypothetical protein
VRSIGSPWRSAVVCSRACGWKRACTAALSAARIALKSRSTTAFTSCSGVAACAAAEPAPAAVASSTANIKRMQRMGIASGGEGTGGFPRSIIVDARSAKGLFHVATRRGTEKNFRKGFLRAFQFPSVRSV